MRTTLERIAARDQPMLQSLAILLLAAVYIVLLAHNAVFTLDDPSLVDRFGAYLRQNGLLWTLKVLFFGLDIFWEYRLYGLSRILHFGLWLIFGKHVAGYVATMAVFQLLTGGGLYRLLRRMRFDTTQSGVVALMWVISPFAATSCFHHYSYLILPYSVTVACGLTMQRLHDGATVGRIYPALMAFGAALAWTGESHLLASSLILIYVSLGTPSTRPRVERWQDAAVPIATIAVAALAHRLLWAMLRVPFLGPVRFEPSNPTPAFISARIVHVLRSLWPGLVEQTHPVMTMAGGWIIATAVVVAAGILFYGSQQSSTPALPQPSLSTPDFDFTGRLPLALLSIFAASLAIYFALAVFSTTPELGPALSRRYGFVPYTLVLMVLAAGITEPWTRRFLKVGPAFLCAAVVAFWIVLEAMCIPKIRAQDRVVFHRIRDIARNISDPSILFADAWTRPDLDKEVPTGAAPGLRAYGFPAIFESPLAAYWTEALYASVLLPVHRVGYRAVIKDDGSTVLSVFWPQIPMTVPTDSIILVMNTASQPPPWQTALDSVVVQQGLQVYAVLPAARGQ